MDADDGRLINALLSAGLVGLFILLAWLRWSETPGTRRCMWVGFIVLMAATAYGSYEAVYLGSTFRVAIFTLGLGVMYVGTIAEVVEAWREWRARRQRRAVR